MTPTGSAAPFGHFPHMHKVSPAGWGLALCMQPAFTQWLKQSQPAEWRAAGRFFAGPSDQELAQATVARLCGVVAVSDLRDAEQFRAWIYAPFMAAVRAAGAGADVVE